MAAVFTKSVQVMLQRALDHHQAGQFEAAQQGYRSFLAAQPDNAAGYLHLGVALRHLGRLTEAEGSYRRALALRPDYAEAYGNLAVCLQLQGKLDEATVCCERALALRPHLVQAHFSLGLIRHRQGRLDEAELAYREALVHAPDFAEVLANLGAIHLVQGRFDEAATHLRRARMLNPNLAEVHSNLGAVLKEQGLLHDAEASLRRSLEIQPDCADALNNLGATLTAQGRLEEAEICLRRALSIQPDHLDAHSNLLYALNFSKCESASMGFAEAQRYGGKVAARVKVAGGAFTSWSCLPEPGRLRVGLVSGDLRNHPVGYFLEEILSHIDETRLELIAYPNHAIEDDLTARIQHRFAAWKPLCGMSDEAAARLIHGDGVHVLLDLSGHTGGNRLPVFAWKPAPVQVSWLGYFATTGLAEMDYLLADEVGVPSEHRDQFVEKVWCLPDTRLCFTPPDTDLPVAPLPALKNGYLTFGCVQNPAKIGESVLALWREVLRAVPTARLRLQNKLFADPQACDRMLARLEQHGIDPGRASLHAALPRRDYLVAYAEVDAILDTFPYPGGTTTCEALWMGVPTLTLAGETLLERQGASLLTAAGLPQWVMESEAEYLGQAVALANDLPSLVNLRTRLREQVRQSALFDAQRFARNLEVALWGMLRFDSKRSCHQ